MTKSNDTTYSLLLDVCSQTNRQLGRRRKWIIELRNFGNKNNEYDFTHSFSRGLRKQSPLSFVALTLLEFDTWEFEGFLLVSSFLCLSISSLSCNILSCCLERWSLWSTWLQGEQTAIELAYIIVLGIGMHWSEDCSSPIKNDLWIIEQIEYKKKEVSQFILSTRNYGDILTA